MTAGSPTIDAARPTGMTARNRRILLLLAAIAIAPVALSYAVYYAFPRQAQVHHGTLLPTVTAPEVAGVRADGSPFHLADVRGRWVMVLAAPAGCAADCERLLYASRQARTMQGREQDRVVRVLAGPLAQPSGQALLADHPGLVEVRGTLPPTMQGGPSLLLVDPLGNQVLRYGADADIRGVAKDLSRLLKASRIG